MLPETQAHRSRRRPRLPREEPPSEHRASNRRNHALQLERLLSIKRTVLSTSPGSHGARNCTCERYSASSAGTFSLRLKDTVANLKQVRSPQPRNAYLSDRPGTNTRYFRHHHAHTVRVAHRCSPVPRTFNTVSPLGVQTNPRNRCVLSFTTSMQNLTAPVTINDDISDEAAVRRVNQATGNVSVVVSRAVLRTASNAPSGIGSETETPGLPSCKRRAKAVFSRALERNLCSDAGGFQLTGGWSQPVVVDRGQPAGYPIGYQPLRRRQSAQAQGSGKKNRKADATVKRRERNSYHEVPSHG